jgi:hypothetical protein
MVIWNQSLSDEVHRSLQRHRLTAAISKDGGATWRHHKNVFSIFYQEDDLTYVEPPTIQPYRALEHAPRLPPNDVEGTYPTLTFWKDHAIIQHLCREREYYIEDEQGQTGHERGQDPSVSTQVLYALPISWFYS